MLLSAVLSHSVSYRNDDHMEYNIDLLLSKLKENTDMISSAEFGTCLRVFREDAQKEQKYTGQFGYFYFLVSKYLDATNANEVQSIRQNYIYALRMQRNPDMEKLDILYLHTAEYYYAIHIYSECIRYLFMVLDNKAASAKNMSVATSMLFSVLAENNMYSECFPYMEKLQQTLAEHPISSQAMYIQEMSFMQLYGISGDTAASERYYLKLKNTDPLPDGIGTVEVAYMELLHLSVIASARPDTPPGDDFYGRVISVCSALSADSSFRDSNYALTIIPVIRYMLPYISEKQLLELYDLFPSFVYSTFDRLRLLTFLFEEINVPPASAPDIYEHYLKMLKLYYRSNQDNHRMVVENEMAAHSMEKEYRRIALTDRLTSLGNRQAYTEMFQRYADESVPLDDRLCVVMMDIDSLKKQNDTFGHEAGDRLITAAASVIRKIFGCDSELFRYGGDEFVAVLETTREVIADRILILREACREYNKSTGTAFRAELSISTGFSFASEVSGSNCERLRKMASTADARMYEDKKKRH